VSNGQSEYTVFDGSNESGEDMTDTMESIPARHPVRAEFSAQSTGSENGCYYNTKGHAIDAFCDALKGANLCLDPYNLADFHGDEGRKVVDVHNELGHVVGYAVLTWHRMGVTGRYEFLGYLT